VWSLLRTGRWIGFTVVVIVSIVAFGILSAWQWSRAEERRVERIELTDRLTATSVPLEAAGSAEYTRVFTKGSFVERSDRLVRSRPQGGGNGFWVVSALEPSSDPSTYVWVVRGWMPSQNAATSVIDVPPAPSGVRAVEGYLRTFESTGPTPGDLPAGQITAMSTTQLPRLDGQAYDVWIQSAEGEGELEVLVLPEIDEGRNISYAVQWLLFAAVAIGGWFIFLRREAREDARKDAHASELAN